MPEFVGVRPPIRTLMLVVKVEAYEDDPEEAASDVLDEAGYHGLVSIVSAEWVEERN